MSSLVRSYDYERSSSRPRRGTWDLLDRDQDWLDDEDDPGDDLDLLALLNRRGARIREVGCSER